MTKAALRISIVVSGAVSLSAAAESPPSAPPTAIAATSGTDSFTAVSPFRLVLATIAPPESPWGELARTWRDKMLQESAGRLRIQLKLGANVASEHELVDRCLRGEADMVAVSAPAVASSAVPAFSVLSLPYLFSSQDQAEYVLDNRLFGVLGAALRERGLVLYRYDDAGWLSLGSRFGPVRTPADLENRRMRAQNAPVNVATLRGFHSSVVALPPQEVYPALASDAIEGYEQTPLLTLAFGLGPNTRHYTLTRHVYQFALVVINRRVFESIPADLVEVLMRDGPQAAAVSRRAVRRLEAEALGALRALGVEVHELSERERRAFELAARNVRTDFSRTLDPLGKKLLAEVNAAKAEYQESLSGLASRQDPAD